MRRALFVIVVGLVFGFVPPLVAAPSGQSVVEECRSSSPDDFERGCRSVEQIVRGFGAECRRRDVDETAVGSCESLDGRRIGLEQMVEYEAGWVHRALALQRDLDAARPLWEQQIVHTHNSFNSSSYDPTLTNQDPNQVYGLTDQLQMDVRFLELDLHWAPSVHGSAATGGQWVTLCHGNSGYVPGVHIGCSNDRPLQDGLAEIRAWLDAHPDEFLFIYLENQLGGSVAAHDVAAGLLSAAFPAPLVYAPSSACGSLPLDVSRLEMMATGARVLFVGNCGPGAWGGLVHERGPSWDEGGDTTGYGTAACAADRAARLGHTNFRRWFGDSTWLTAMTSKSTDIPAETAAAMVECGANIIGFDQLQPQDGKLAAMVWSWSPDEALSPSGPCAAQNGDGRIAGRACADVLRFACVDGSGSWSVTAAAGAWADGTAACAAEFPGTTFGVPWNGVRNQLLFEARGTGGDVWLDYAEVGGQWTPEASG